MKGGYIVQDPQHGGWLLLEGDAGVEKSFQMWTICRLYNTKLRPGFTSHLSSATNYFTPGFYLWGGEWLWLPCRPLHSWYNVSFSFNYE
jgi:hypothetical protein